MDEGAQLLVCWERRVHLLDHFLIILDHFGMSWYVPLLCGLECLKLDMPKQPGIKTLRFVSLTFSGGWWVVCVCFHRDFFTLD